MNRRRDQEKQWACVVLKMPDIAQTLSRRENFTISCLAIWNPFGRILGCVGGRIFGAPPYTPPNFLPSLPAIHGLREDKGVGTPMSHTPMGAMLQIVAADTINDPDPIDGGEIRWRELLV